MMCHMHSDLVNDCVYQAKPLTQQSSLLTFHTSLLLDLLTTEGILIITTYQG